MSRKRPKTNSTHMCYVDIYGKNLFRDANHRIAEVAQLVSKRPSTYLKQSSGWHVV